VLSVGSVASVGSVLSCLSRWSILAWRSSQARADAAVRLSSR
jgi:hypothetical protein